MRVLHVASWYPHDASDIAGVFVQEHIRSLVPHAEQLVVAPAIDGTGRARDEGGYHVVRPRVPAFRGLWLLPYIAQVWRHALRFRPDIIHAHIARPAGVAACWVANRLRVPLVVTEQTGGVRALLETHALNRAAARWAFRSAAACTGVSSDHAADLRTLIGGVEPIVVPNTVDPERFLKRPPAVDGVPRLLFIGRLVAVKNCQILLEALQDPRLLSVPWTLRIVGAGPEEQTLHSRAIPLGNRVRFEGYQPPAAVPGLLAEADVFVLPSLKESFGAVVIESLAAGVPVLATRCGGPEDSVTDAVGRLVAPGSARALVEGLEWMLAHHKSFAPEALRAYAEARFGYAAVAQQFLEIYSRVLVRRTRTA